jgi:hypothetical protein
METNSRMQLGRAWDLLLPKGCPDLFACCGKSSWIPQMNGSQRFVSTSQVHFRLAFPRRLCPIGPLFGTAECQRGSSPMKNQVYQFVPGLIGYPPERIKIMNDGCT